MLGGSTVEVTFNTTSSRLSKTLLEILHDKDALQYFTQFLESVQDAAVIKFWLEAEHFKVTAGF